MTGVRSSTVVTSWAVAALWMVCGAAACSKSHPRTSGALDAEVEGATDGGARHAPPEPREPARDASATPVTQPGAEPDAGEHRDDPIGGPPAPIAGGPPGARPPPDIVYERAEGTAVLDIDPDAVPTWLDRIICEKALQCGVGGVELLTQEECEGLMGGPCSTYPQVPREEVDPECIQAVDEAHCNDAPAVLMTPVCIESLTRVMSTIAGTTELGAEGAVCGSSAFCQSGLMCRDQVGLCGVCRPYGELGDDCSDQPCLGGYCDDETLLCTPYLRAGEPCDGSGGCPTGCGVDGRCRGLLDSAFQSSPQYSGCVDSGQCGGAQCRDGYCLPLAPLGAACERDEECSLRRCHEGVCATSASCELPGEGEYCARGSRCAPPFMCQFGQCRPFLGLGDPLPEGAQCALAAQCATGSCVNGVCAARGPGYPCESDEECLPGRCVYNVCVPESMQPCGEPL